MKTIDRIKITKGSGSVYVDLAFSTAEYRNLHLPSQRMTAQRNFIEKEELTQPDAARSGSTSASRGFLL